MSVLFITQGFTPGWHQGAPHGAHFPLHSAHELARKS